VTERLYRDLRAACRVNHQLVGLERLRSGASLTRAQIAAVKQALGLADKRPIDIVEIRPRVDLPGGAFSGLSRRALRRAYLDAGRRAASDALARLAILTAKAS